MIEIVDYLIKKGYKPYRFSVEDQEYVLPAYNDDFTFFSRTIPNCLDVRLWNGEREFIYGLNRNGSTPTLKSPRPNNITTDNDMDKLFSNLSFDEIYNLCTNERNEIIK